MLPAVGEKGDLLIELVALGLEHPKEPAFRFLIIRLHEGKALTGDGLLRFLTSLESHEALANDDFEATLLALGADVSAIDTHRKRTIGDG